MLFFQQIAIICLGNGKENHIFPCIKFIIAFSCGNRNLHISVRKFFYNGLGASSVSPNRCAQNLPICVSHRLLRLCEFVKILFWFIQSLLNTVIYRPVSETIKIQSLSDCIISLKTVKVITFHIVRSFRCGIRICKQGCRYCFNALYYRRCNLRKLYKQS